MWVVAHHAYDLALAEYNGKGRDALFDTTPNGYTIQSAVIAIMNKQAALMMKAAAELGFSPASRARVSVRPDGGDADPAEEFFA